METIKSQPKIKSVLLASAFADGIFDVPKNQINNVLDPNQDNPKIKWGTPFDLVRAYTQALGKSYRLGELIRNFALVVPNEDMEPQRKGSDLSIERMAVANFKSGYNLNKIGMTEKPPKNDTFLPRVFISALRIIKEYGPDFINNETAMNKIHQMVSITHNYPNAFVAASFLTLLVNEVIADSSSKTIYDNSLGVVYEYYSMRELFAGELMNLSALNVPDFYSIEKEDLVNDEDAFHTLENMIWIIQHSNNFSSAVKRALNFKQHNETLVMIVAMFAVLKFDDDQQLQQLQKKINNFEFVDLTAKNAVNSNNFI